MKPKVYIETTVVSYLTAWPSRDVVIAGYQQTTRDWWTDASERFELVVSELVITEASDGDATAASDRLDALRGITLLDATEQAAELAQHLIESGAIPEKAAEDAGHIAIAVTNGVEYLVTWNCRHIANATMRSQIDKACRNAGYEPTVICTPDELMEPENEDKNE
ncbi:MAG: DNA-binding protein [Gammaproteobacteria bacterium]|nr:DNA-binding protein [Gammaproteobacteria bacterium]